VPWTALSGGVVFATQYLAGSQGYDLYWVAAPPNATIDPQIPVRLTSASGNEWQPSVSAGGNSLAFVKEDDGILLISASGRISRVSTSDARYKDAHPAVSPDGARVAWVREDHSQPIGKTGFYTNTVWMANFDGKNAAPLVPERAMAGVIQDAPVFDPDPSSPRIAWSEFNATTLSPAGPSDYGIFVYDYNSRSGRYACMNPPIQIADRAYRCFGEHLSWPRSDLIVTGQDLLEVHLDGGETTIWGDLTSSIIRQEVGTPQIGARPDGFFPQFPLSISYSRNLDRFVFDGVLVPHDLDAPTTAIFFADITPGRLGFGEEMGNGNGELGGVWRLPIDGYANDIDFANTANYLFSVATPQFIP
jgi:hypothetical protein